MKQNKVFLVNDPLWGSKVITANSFENDVKEHVKDLNIKPKNVESYVQEALDDLSGTALEQKDYEHELEKAKDALVMFTNLTPYSFYEKYVYVRG